MRRFLQCAGLIQTIVLAGLAACRDSATPESSVAPPIVVKTISVSAADPDVATGYLTRVSATITVAGRTPFAPVLKWVSSDTSIATVEPEHELTALVAAKSPGSVTISAIAGAKTASTEIAVFPYQPRTPAHGFFWTAESGMTDLGVLPGMTESRPRAINNADEVVGFSKDSVAGRGFYWSPATGITEISGWPNGGDAVPTGINDADQIIGYTPGPRGFIWTAAGGAVDLGWLDDAYRFTMPSAINASGVVVGYSGSRPFRWTTAKGIEALTFPYGDYGQAVAVNDMGEIAGFLGYAANDGTKRAVLWTADNQFSSVLCCASWATGINESRAITGIKEARTAFLWTPTSGAREIGFLPRTNWSKAVDVNSSAQVVGNSSTAFVYRVFVWSEATGMQDIGVLAGKPVCFATAINDRGHVIGYCQ
jgi:hypothetical protein